ncbi:hypothetical protein EUTSA_v10024559mg [Eutrema salsugineum]|uniref:Protein phosphatase n=1 Tax=Eutrema salsugineum TaxID=72664 RepID=V4MEV5_EUTSA|nr:probable protein phosphatase 2C 62 isoform X2 [Eutrema salsugineum]ESQ53802.1 hypothetical protein EUTSA_v10024559mg [Eutrema salsugineum]
MADHLILSLQPPPFLIFPCSLHHRPLGRFAGGVRFSVPEFRLSSQLQLANSVSPSQSSSSPPSNSSPEKFDLVSSTQLKDGSHVFRFGDASEIEKYLEAEEKARCVEAEKQRAKIAEEASDASRKQDGHTLGDLDPFAESEGAPKEKSDAKKKSVNSNTEETAPSNLSNVIKIKDRKRVRSPTKKKKDTSASVNVSRGEDKVEAKVAIVSSMVSVAEAIPSGSTEEKAVVSGKSEPINENEITVESYNAEPLPSQVMETGSVNEIGDRETNAMEVQARPRSSTSQHGPQSTFELGDNLDVSENPMKTFEAEEKLVVEPTATLAVSPDELISTSKATHRSISEIVQEPLIDTSEENLMKTVEAEENILVEPEATHRSVDGITEKPVIDTSEVANERENAASTLEDETVRDTKTDNGSISKSTNDTKGEDLPLPAPETAGLESIKRAAGREELVSKAFYLDSGFASLQNPFKALAGREDAYFISPHNWIGIADGVSQWSFEGINKGMYAQELMSNCQKIVSDETAKISDPIQILHRSVNEIKSPGSSTALIAHLDNNELHIANIGDSGFMVIRDGTVLQKSSPMFHHFCFPLQITQGNDIFKLAQVYHVNLEEGDVVITATDGLFDNLYEEDIVSIVCRSLEQSLEPQKIADLVAAKAQEVGRSETESTPFADAAKEEGYDGYNGGKPDAVTVIVSFVKSVST